MNNNLEELINALYDMIQDAKSVPLSSDKCIIERDKALDMLDCIECGSCAYVCPAGVPLVLGFRAGKQQIRDAQKKSKP